MIFNDWLVKWDNGLDHRIMLLVNDSPAHSVCVSLKNIKVIYLPTDTTSVVPPCDQGVIRTLKAYYRRNIHSRILEGMGETAVEPVTTNDLAKKTTTLLDALHVLAMSWHHVASAVIRSCFKRSGFVKEEEEAVKEEHLEEESMQPEGMTEGEFENWLAIDERITVTAKLTEEDVCEVAASTSTPAEVGIDFNVEDGDEEILPMGTHVEVRKALEVVREYVLQTGEDFQKHYEYERYIHSLLQKDN